MYDENGDDQPRKVYVLQTCFVHDETVVSGVTMDESVAQTWVAENPSVEGVEQRIFRTFETHALIEDAEARR